MYGSHRVDVKIMYIRKLVAENNYVSGNKENIPKEMKEAKERI